jgi:hypothetical protein
MQIHDRGLWLQLLAPTAELSADKRTYCETHMRRMSLSDVARLLPPANSRKILRIAAKSRLVLDIAPMITPEKIALVQRLFVQNTMVAVIEAL